MNLYFNQHLDLDLAEQDALSCGSSGSCKGGSHGSTLDYYTNTGVVAEVFFPSPAIDANGCDFGQCDFPPCVC